jgi:hypothetical protein
VDD